MRSIATINLVGNSDVYQQFLYPAGEMQVRLTPAGVELVTGADEIRIIARIKSASEIIELVLLKSAIFSVNQDAKVHLILPYLPYSRADRRFLAGDCFGLATFVDIINGSGFNVLSTLDVHSYRNTAILFGGYVRPQFVDRSALPLISSAILKFAEEHKAERVTVLYPDKGACARYSLGLYTGNNQHLVGLDTFQCEKKRDPETGRLLGFKVPELPDQPTIIVDDICDGGGTFLGIAGEIQNNAPLGLYVTHGIFSQGLSKLKAAFSNIYTTNTLDQLGNASQITVLDAMPLLLQQ